MSNNLFRQYFILVMILLVAGFVITQIQWGDQPVLSGLQSVNSPTTDLAGDRPSRQEEITSNDLRSGGLSRSNRPQSRNSPRSTATDSGLSSSPGRAATSTVFSTATSTPINYGSGDSTSYEGVNATFTNNTRERPRSTADVQKGSSFQRADTSTASEQSGMQEQTTPQEETPDASEDKPDVEGNEHPDAVGGHEIAGHIVDEKGSPVKDMALTLKIRQASDLDLEAFGKRTVLNTHSNEKGEYRFLSLVEGDYLICTAETASYKTVCQSPRAPNTSADFLLRHVSGGYLAGSVLDEGGKPVEKVSISAAPGQSSRTESNAKGEFQLNMSVNVDVDYSIYFKKEGYDPLRVSVKGTAVLAGKPLKATLKKLTTGFKVTGTVYDQSGGPVAGRKVTLYSPSVEPKRAFTGTSDAHGEFVIEHVVTAKDFHLNVNAGSAYTFDASSYRKMHIYPGIAPLQLKLQASSIGSFSAYVTSSDGQAVVGETFSLYSNSKYAGRAVSDSGGGIRYEKVPVKQGGSALRITGGSTPRHTFSGIKITEGEHKSGIQLIVGRGQNNLVVRVLDENQTPLSGAQGVLSWTKSENGVRSQTTHSHGKISKEDSGTINFSELGLGEHQLQVRLKNYTPHSASINISQQTQYQDVVLVRAKKN